MQKVLIIFLAIISFLPLNASHLAGGEIWYTHIVDSTYDVHYRMYRDCTGITAPTAVVLRYRSSDLGIDSSAIMVLDTFYENNTCLDNTCQNTNSSLLGIEVYEYSKQVVFRPAEDWKMAAVLSARNPSNNLQGGALYVEATLDNLVQPNNSTIPYVSINMRKNASITSSFNFPMLDSDGDFLEIQFTNPLSSGSPFFTPQVLNYTNGATVLNPFNSTPAPVLQSNSGNITLFPCPQADMNFAVIIKEYRNNKLVGTAMRDYLFSFVADNNLPPRLTGINNTGLFDTTITVCPTNNFSFAVHSADSNLTDSTFVFCTSKPLGATFAANHRAKSNRIFLLDTNFC